MATVYKIEVELTSHWVNYDEKTMTEIVKKKLQEIEVMRMSGNEVTIGEIDVKRKA